MAAPPEPTVSSSDNHQQATDSPRSMSGIRSYFCRTRRLDENVCNQNYSGKGTADDPYVIDYLQNDYQDAMSFSAKRKWATAVLQSMSTLAVTFASSAYASGIEGVKRDFDVSGEVATLGLSLFVLGFALGPLIWAPLSELYGRKSIYVISFMACTAFSVAATCSPNIQSLLVLRFFASAFGSSSMTNTGGVIADMFTKEQPGIATGLFVTAPFLGPALGRWSDHRRRLCHCIVPLLILGFIYFRSHCWRFPRRDPWLALDSRVDRHPDRCGLDCDHANYSRNICAVHSAISSEQPLQHDRKLLCIPSRFGKAAQDTHAGAISCSLAPLDSSVLRTHCLADVAVHVYRLCHTIHVFCRSAHRPSKNLEAGIKAPPDCRLSASPLAYALQRCWQAWTINATFVCVR